MEELATGGFVGKFGLDLRLLIAQVVNLLIVLFVLSRFVFRPLLKTMRERSENIAKGLHAAEEIAVKKEELRRFEESERARAQRETSIILARAETDARTRRDEVLRQAEAEAQAMHDRASAEAARLHEDALLQARRDVGELVIDVTQRVLDKNMTGTERTAYLRRVVEEIKQREDSSS